MRGCSLFHVVAAALLTLIYGLPLLGLSALFDALPDSAPLRALVLVLAPVLYALGFVTTAGLLSRPFHRAIVPGSFPRDLRLKAYRGRRLYGLCWTAVYYCTPIYWTCLTIPPLKTLLFRLFGYRGQMRFTVYPDTWIRDLPLLDFGEGAYVANRSTLGTNVCLNDGTILVDRISLAKRTMVGHMSMLAPGVVMEEGAETGVAVALGMRVHLEPGVSVGGCCDVSHLTRMEAGSSTGTSVAVGGGCRIGPRVHVPGGTYVPNRTRWKTAEDMRAALGLADETRAAAPAAPRRERARAGSPTDVEPPAADPALGRVPASDGATAEFRAHWNAFE